MLGTALSFASGLDPVVFGGDAGIRYVRRPGCTVVVAELVPARRVRVLALLDDVDEISRGFVSGRRRRGSTSTDRLVLTERFCVEECPGEDDGCADHDADHAELHGTVRLHHRGDQAHHACEDTDATEPCGESSRAGCRAYGHDDAGDEDEQRACFVAIQVHTWIHGMVDLIGRQPDGDWPPMLTLLDELGVRLGLTTTDTTS